jgi:hypothetical protein
MLQTVKGRKSVSDRVAQFGGIVHDRLTGRFKEIGINYPPKKLILVGLKHERVLEVWVANEGSEFLFLKRYPILAASGTLGPKLAEGDKQVPEGLYKIASLNPNSLYHLSEEIRRELIKLEHQGAKGDSTWSSLTGRESISTLTCRAISRWPLTPPHCTQTSAKEYDAFWRRHPE